VLPQLNENRVVSFLLSVLFAYVIVEVGCVLL
jgi:hypothetical protein